MLFRTGEIIFIIIVSQNKTFVDFIHELSLKIEDIVFFWLFQRLDKDFQGGKLKIVNNIFGSLPIFFLA